MPLPHDCNDELSSFMNSIRNVEVEQILDQPEDKRAGIRKEVFLKGKQKNLEDVIVLIGVAGIREFGILYKLLFYLDQLKFRFGFYFIWTYDRIIIYLEVKIVFLVFGT